MGGYLVHNSLQYSLNLKSFYDFNTRRLTWTLYYFDFDVV